MLCIDTRYYYGAEGQSMKIDMKKPTGKTGFKVAAEPRVLLDSCPQAPGETASCSEEAKFDE